MKIVVDLDGVLRDLNIALNNRYNVPIPNEWKWEYKGKNIFEWMKFDNYNILTNAPRTKYFEWIINNIKPLEIWTNQIEPWKKHTRKWLKENVPNAKVIYLTGEEKEERLRKNKNIYLIEDSPKFDSYNQIILIDQPYNKKIKTNKRAKNVNELKKIIEEL